MSEPTLATIDGRLTELLGAIEFLSTYIDSRHNHIDRNIGDTKELVDQRFDQAYANIDKVRHELAAMKHALSEHIAKAAHDAQILAIAMDALVQRVTHIEQRLRPILSDPTPKPTPTEEREVPS